MTERKLVPLYAQPDPVFFIDSAIPANELSEAAARRLVAVEDMLRVLEYHQTDDVLIYETARLASALVPLVGEARQLYELALEAPR